MTLFNLFSEIKMNLCSFFFSPLSNSDHVCHMTEANRKAELYKPIENPLSVKSVKSFLPRYVFNFFSEGEEPDSPSSDTT